MLVGAINVQRVVENSNCRITEPYKLTVIGDYRIHATTLMPLVPFERSKTTTVPIDNSIFLNDGDTKLTFLRTVKVQNYLTTHYIGRAPHSFYGPPTPMGTEFKLVCEGGDPSYERRYFGTEGAVGANNVGANELVTFSR